MDSFNSKEYKRSRGAYVSQCAFACFMVTLTGGDFLAKLLTNIGVSDSLIGIISSLPYLALSFQLSAFFLEKSKIGAKRASLLFEVIGLFFFVFIYITPFLPISDSFKSILLFISILFSLALRYSVFSVFFKWANSFIAPAKRASFSAINEIVSLVSLTAVSLISAYIVDRFEENGNIRGGFLFIAILLLVFGILNLLSVALIKKDAPTEKETSIPFKEVLKNSLGNKSFRNVVWLMCIWNFSLCFISSFLGVFRTKDLAMSLLLIQIMGFIANAIRVAVSLPFGRFSDRKSFAKGFELGLILAAISFLFIVFTTNKTWYFMLFHMVFFAMCLAGTNQNSYNIMYSYVDSKYFSQAMAIKNAVSGIVGFLSSVLAGKLLGIIEKNGNQIFGIHVYGQQVLAAVSFIGIIISIIFLRTVIAKQKVIVQ